MGTKAKNTGKRWSDEDKEALIKSLEQLHPIKFDKWWVDNLNDQFHRILTAKSWRRRINKTISEIGLKPTIAHTESPLPELKCCICGTKDSGFIYEYGKPETAICSPGCLEKENRKAKDAPPFQPCGHPVSAIHNTDFDGTRYCKECAKECGAENKQAEKEPIEDITSELISYFTTCPEEPTDADFESLQPCPGCSLRDDEIESLKATLQKNTESFAEKITEYRHENEDLKHRLKCENESHRQQLKHLQDAMTERASLAESRLGWLMRKANISIDGCDVFRELIMMCDPRKIEEPNE